MGKAGVAAAIIMLASPALPPAKADALDSLRGKFAFDWRKDLNTVACAPIDPSLLKALKSPRFVCNIKARTNSASGVPVMSCASKDDKVEYLIFSTAALCDKELAAQRDNGD
jgi:hypothetical protein